MLVRYLDKQAQKLPTPVSTYEQPDVFLLFDETLVATCISEQHLRVAKGSHDSVTIYLI